jgi:transcriptional regulator with XRE-family HTH domain
MPSRPAADLPAAYGAALGAALARRRDRSGLKADAAARKAGLHRVTLYALERDAGRTTLGTLHALAGLYGTTPARLLAEAEKILAKLAQTT